MRRNYKQVSATVINITPLNLWEDMRAESQCLLPNPKLWALKNFTGMNQPPWSWLIPVRVQDLEAEGRFSDSDNIQNACSTNTIGKTQSNSPGAGRGPLRSSQRKSGSHLCCQSPAVKKKKKAPQAAVGSVPLSTDTASCARETASLRWCRQTIQSWAKGRDKGIKDNVQQPFHGPLQDKMQQPFHCPLMHFKALSAFTLKYSSHFALVTSKSF